ncbi:hypothetical protein M7I_0014 [Glarea lozoyensis 74030]|uniref:Uncharacterized protein n=1 Tax=Glarea lozoyensis (strain ATCC 74030 / MF5533) TaxID=1104152 RepID=H0EC81_GLAL7|nr:hypothetical protein M7I_0014 [Glarea lozoyensis 74030]
MLANNINIESEAPRPKARTKGKVNRLDQWGLIDDQSDAQKTNHSVLGVRTGTPSAPMECPNGLVEEPGPLIIVVQRT